MFRSTHAVVSCLMLLTIVSFQAGFIDAKASSGNSLHCPAFDASPLSRTPTKVTKVDPSNWIQAIENSISGEEILLENGLYPLNENALPLATTITIRSESGDRNSVVIQGKGLMQPGNGLVIYADDVHIADLTIKDVRDHGIAIQEGFSRPVIYNVNTLDIGTHHIKSNRGGPGGVVACSRLGYTQPVATGDYMGGIDLHKAVNWTIRDNYIYNIYGDGSGCVVDRECGTIWPGGDAAILIWQNSHDNIIERNTIVESYRGISLGLDTPYSGGSVRDNVICRSTSGKEGVNGFIDGDTGISLLGANNVVVQGNRVILAGNYSGPVELKDAKGIVIENNILSKPVWNRGNAKYNGCDSEICRDHNSGNITDADSSNVTCPADARVLVALATDISQPSATTALLNKDELASITPSVSDAAVDTDAQLTDSRRLLKEKQLLLIEERILLIEERILFKEEQIKMLEERIIMEVRFQAILIELLNTQLILESTLRQLESHKH